MKFFYIIILSILFVAGCGRSEKSHNPPEIVSRDSDTVFNDIPGKHHLGEGSFNMNIVDLLENVRKTHAFLKILEEEGLRDTLRTEGPFTVFALSDATLNGSDTISSGDISSTSDKGGAQIGESIRRYVISGEITRSDLANQPVTATDLSGNSITIRLENGNLVINDKVYSASGEFVAENGVVYELTNALE